MISCFLCQLNFANPHDLCEHIRALHPEPLDDYLCTLCYFSFTKLHTLRTHMEVCINKRSEHWNDEDESDLLNVFVTEPIAENQQMSQFESGVKQSALEIILELLANMSLARKICFVILEMFRIFVSKIVEGLKLIVCPIIGEEHEHIIEDFITTIEKSFDDVNTESRLHSTLVRVHLIDPLQKYGMFDSEEEDEDEDEDEDEEIDEADEDDEEESDVESEEEVDYEKPLKPAKFSLSPFHFEIKRFLELPNVFETIQKNTNCIQQQLTLNHFIKGELWKDKLREFSAGQNVMPFHLYMDGAQLNNALGTHTSAGLENFTYYTLPTVPSQYQSRLENIFCAAFHSAADIKLHGNEASFNNLIEEINKLSTDGVVLNINGEEHHVYIVIGLMLGDNLELNDVLGYTKAFSNANHPCRTCSIHKRLMKNQFTEIEELLRDRLNYDDDVALNNLTHTGVKENCAFNSINFFHAVENVGVDLTHDLYEGVLHYNLAEFVIYWINLRKYFVLKQLNERVQAFAYAENETGNKPSLITMKKLKKKRLSMTASEMSCFARYLGFIIGDLITDADDIGWKFYNKTMKFVDLCELPSYDDEDLDDLGEACEDMNHDYVNVFNRKMKFKHHNTTHYKRLTRRYGPLKNIKVIRMEGKHKEMKSYSKNNNSRKNLSLSLSKKVQYNTALRFLKCKGLEDKVVPNFAKVIRLKDQEYYSNLTPSVYVHQISENECRNTRKVVVNGILFARELWLPDFFDFNNIKIHRIVDVLPLEHNAIDSVFVVCKTYDAKRNERFGCHSVEIESMKDNFTIIKIQDFLLTHQYPVKVHIVNSISLFRCRRF